MRRSDALAELSRDHHQALFAAQRLARATPETANEACAAFQAFWDRERHHFRIEEEILLPALARHVPPDHEAIVRVLTEHVDLRRRARDLVAEPIALRELGTRLREHVRHEERTLFPLVQAALSEDELAELGATLARHDPAPS
jgi:hemerythrin-like domain-containing protein